MCMIAVKNPEVVKCSLFLQSHDYPQFVRILFNAKHMINHEFHSITYCAENEYDKL